MTCVLKLPMIQVLRTCVSYSSMAFYRLVTLPVVTNILSFFCFKGAKVLTGGKKHGLGMTFYEPTVLTDVKNEMLLSR